MAAISQQELARRICAANHPFYGQTGYQTPCGQHLRDASLSYGLLDPQNRTTLLAIARSAGLLDELRDAYYRVPAGEPTVEQLLQSLPALYAAALDLIGTDEAVTVAP
jgi:hypothetical protein